MQVAIATRARDNDRHCGDQAGYWHHAGKTILCMVDGLGHGEHAELAATAALAYVAKHLGESLHDIFAGCDQALRSTRGVAMGIAVVDRAKDTITYAGIGNTRGMIVGETTVRLTSDFGIVGGGYQQLHCQTGPLRSRELAILSTDGVEERLEVSPRYDAQHVDVQWLAGRLLGEWGRQTDDAGVLVFRKEST